jgi:hypothetical protein
MSRTQSITTPKKGGLMVTLKGSNIISTIYIDPIYDPYAADA